MDEKRLDQGELLGEQRSGGPKLLDIENIRTCFTAGKKITTILDGVSLELSRGEIIGLVGESGSGKSITMLSTLRLLPGTGYIDKGSIELDENGVNLAELPAKSPVIREVRGGRIGMIFQEPMTSLNPVMPVGEQIREAIVTHLDMNKEDSKARAIEMMRLVNIPDAEVRYNEYPMQFSGGMRQRIVIAMVLAAKPDIIIADEATTALDVTTQAQLLEMIRDLSAKTGVSVIIVTHNLGIVARYAQRIYVMYAGNVVEEGCADDIFHRPGHPYTRGLLKAIPRLNDPKDRVLIPIDGLPPMPQNRPDWCPFYDRCEYRLDRCKELPRPELTEFEPGHSAACHLSEAEKAARLDELEHTEQRARPEKKLLDEVCLEVSHVSKRFDIRKGLMQRKIATLSAVDDVSFTLHRGETLGIVGESGCGKTTLARTILRMYAPSEGEIRLYGTDIAHLKGRALGPYRKKMAMVFQDPFSSLDPRMTAGDIVAEPLVIHRSCAGRAELSERVDELFEMVGLDPLLRERLPHEFSGGQRQRIGIARALASDPDIILCDEPISALDVSIQAQVINLLEDLQAKMGLAYLFIAHDLAVVKHISDRILVMYLGRVMEIAPSDEIYENPLHPYTKTLLSAVPIADPAVERQRTFSGPRGEVPSVLDRPKGCPFSNRCEFATERCLSEAPELTDCGNGHTVACFRY